MGPAITLPVLENLAPCLGQTNSEPPELKLTVSPSWVQAADTAKNEPADVLAIIIPFCTSDPPLVAKLPEEMSTVKSTSPVGATLFSEQAYKPPRQTGAIKTAALNPT